MPGSNCCIPGCGSSRRTKDMGFFKLPDVKKQHFADWRKKWLDEILKVRELDKDLKAQLEADTVHTCEKHYYPHEWETCKLTYILSSLSYLYLILSYDNVLHNNDIVSLAD